METPRKTRNQRRALSRKRKAYSETTHRRVARENRNIDDLPISSITLKQHHVAKIHQMISHWLEGMESSEHSEKRAMVTKRIRDTPYFLPTMSNRGQIVAVKLFSSSQPITTTAATAYTTVIGMTASLFPFFSSLSTAFEEYRYIRGKVYYVPEYLISGSSGLTCGAAVACVDPIDPNPFSSRAGPWNSDNKATFDLCILGGGKEQRGLGNAIWHVPMDSMPDKQWIATTITNLSPAYWKPYVPAANSPGTFTTGYVMVEMNFQFRGLG